MIEENLKKVHENIIAACEKANRSVDEITLIDVSKTKPVSMIEECIKCGEKDFGENKVQEMCDKMEILKDQKINWHLIGHLQRNKVKYIIGKAKLIHSVDSVRLAKQIEQESAKKNLVTDILLEVNVANEDSKFGFQLNEVKENLKIISEFAHVRVKGLMTVAPYTPNPEENRKYFSQLHDLYVDINQENIDNVNMTILSMGMTNDYQIAIEEGATMVRVGTGIFGERNYNI